MNIYIFTHIYPTTDEFNIVQDTKVIHFFARDWKEMGHNVQVVYLQHWAVKECFQHGVKYLKPQEAHYEYEGVPVCLIQYQLVTLRRRFPEKFQIPAIDNIIGKMMDKNPPDIIFAHFPSFYIGLESVKRAPSIGVFHLSDMINMGFNHKQNMTDGIMAHPMWGSRNRQIQAELKEKYGRDSYIVYSGIDENLIAKKEEIEEKKKEKNDVLRLIYVGNLMARKKADTLIEAVGKTEVPCSLEIIGDGEERARFETLANNVAKGKVSFCGRLPREEVMKHMHDADAFIMVSEAETYGLVYLEAMGQGCISVGSIGEGIDGIIKDGENGFLLPAGDVDAVVGMIQRLHNMTIEEKSRIIDKGYETTCSMTSRMVSEKYLADCCKELGVRKK